MKVAYITFDIDKGDGGSLGSSQNFYAFSKIFSYCEFVKYRIPIPDSFLRKLIFYIRLAMFGRSLKVDLDEFDVLVFDSIYLLKSVKSSDANRVVFFHNYEPEYLYNEFKGIKRAMLCSWYRSCLKSLKNQDVLIVTNGRDRDLYEKKMPFRFNVSYPTFKFEDFLGDGERPVRNVGFMSSNSVQNFESLKIISTIARKNSQVKFHIFGKVPDISSLNFSSNVIFRGYVGELLSEFSEMDASIAPLKSPAGIKLKIIESLSFGIPVFTTESGIVSLPEDVRNSSFIYLFSNPENFLLPKSIYLNEKDFIQIKNVFDLTKKEEGIRDILIRSNVHLESR